MSRLLPKLFFNTESEILQKVIELYNEPQYTQRTPEWYEARNSCISASDAASALLQTKKATQYYIESFGDLDNFSFTRKPKSSCNTYSSKEELILKKCNLGPEFTGNVFTAHGVKYENVASVIYSQINQVDVLEFGLIVHTDPEYPFIAASPDGITTQGVMIEIKCPPSRRVKNYPSLHYFIQMLIQLECTGLQRCDFIDAHFIDYVSIDCWMEHAKQFELENPDAKHHIYGILLRKEDEEYIYPDPSIVTLEDFLEWKEKYFEPGYEVTYYKLEEFYISSVEASKNWFLDNLPDLKETWDEILYGRTEEGLEELKAEMAAKEEKKLDRKKKKIEKSLTIETIDNPLCCRIPLFR